MGWGDEPDPNDDLDRAALEERLPSIFAHAKKIEIEMDIQAIRIDGDRAHPGSARIAWHLEWGSGTWSEGNPDIMVVSGG